MEELRHIQRNVRNKIVPRDAYKKPIKRVGGIDLAFLDDTAVVACVIVDYGSLEVQSERCLVTRLDFPYVPSFLCFREGPPILEMIGAMESQPEVYLINAHGVAHPIGCGCASYVGVLANVPTIGVASRNLCGEQRFEPIRVGEYVPVIHNERIVGWVLKTREECRPVFVSPWHCVTLRSSLDIVLTCSETNKLPKPLSSAHTLANEVKKIVLRNMRGHDDP